MSTYKVKFKCIRCGRLIGYNYTILYSKHLLATLSELAVITRVDGNISDERTTYAPPIRELTSQRASFKLDRCTKVKLTEPRIRLTHETGGNDDIIKYITIHNIV